ncbi:hypothetical protein L1887_27716 [Cichorium endivia]|nr:hypothetical protein L1887_27716 [Cichorium endivia]
MNRCLRTEIVAVAGECRCILPNFEKLLVLEKLLISLDTNEYLRRLKKREIETRTESVSAKARRFRSEFKEKEILYRG